MQVHTLCGIIKSVRSTAGNLGSNNAQILCMLGLHRGMRNPQCSGPTPGDTSTRTHVIMGAGKQLVSVQGDSAGERTSPDQN